MVKEATSIVISGRLPSPVLPTSWSPILIWKLKIFSFLDFRDVLSRLNIGRSDSRPKAVGSGDDVLGSHQSPSAELRSRTNKGNHPGIFVRLERRKFHFKQENISILQEWLQSHPRFYLFFQRHIYNLEKVLQNMFRKMNGAYWKEKQRRERKMSSHQFIGFCNLGTFMW